MKIKEMIGCQHNGIQTQTAIYNNNGNFKSKLHLHFAIHKNS